MQLRSLAYIVHTKGNISNSWPPTCLEDLISDGETCSMCLVVRHKLDEQLVSGGDDRRGSDLPAVLFHKLTALVHTVSHLHVVIPEQDKEKGKQCQSPCF